MSLRGRVPAPPWIAMANIFPPEGAAASSARTPEVHESATSTTMENRRAHFEAGVEFPATLFFIGAAPAVILPRPPDHIRSTYMLTRIRSLLVANRGEIAIR